MDKEAFRIEHDLLGQRLVPQNVYWGIHTLRALENFPLGQCKTPLELIRAVTLVKKACCLANRELGFLDESVADALLAACDDVYLGKLDEQFPLHALQGGAGTSTNMNVNEVIANRALEYIGKTKGDYDVIHPVDHVNLHQSTNDTYPTAVKVAAIFGLRRLSEAITKLQEVLQQKEKEFAGIVVIGRTELQNAVPITLGGQFSSFAEAIARDRWRTFKCEERLRIVNIGGTAVGTGLTAPRSYIFLVIEKLRELTGLGLSRGENLLDQTANADVFVEVAGSINAHAANLQKICTDLRLLHFLEEISLPAVQAGSSIMPGKVNPVILEAVISVAIKTKADMQVVTETASCGSLQINELMPLLAFSLLATLDLLTAANTLLSKHVQEIAAHSETCSLHVSNNPTLITAFLPHIGYERAERLVKEYADRNMEEIGFRRFLEERLGKDFVDQVLSPANLMSLGYRTTFDSDHG